MFNSGDSKKELKESMLEKLIEHIMSTPDSEGGEEPSEEMSEERPAMEMQVLEVEAKPKEKFKNLEGVEMEDESLEDILKRKKQEA